MNIAAFVFALLMFVLAATVKVNRFGRPWSWIMFVAIGLLFALLVIVDENGTNSAKLATSGILVALALTAIFVPGKGRA